MLEHKTIEKKTVCHFWGFWGFSWWMCYRWRFRSQLFKFFALKPNRLLGQLCVTSVCHDLFNACISISNIFLFLHWQTLSVLREFPFSFPSLFQSRVAFLFSTVLLLFLLTRLLPGYISILARQPGAGSSCSDSSDGTVSLTKQQDPDLLPIKHPAE